MAGRTLTALTCLGVAVAGSAACGSEDSKGDGGGASGSGASGGAPTLEDNDGDGVPDALGAAAVPITADEIDAMRDAACAGWSAEPEPRGAL